MNENNISDAFPFKSQYQPILGNKIHYIEQGSGDPILFLHGMPASNYLWRNIIPALSQYARCIAPDLIGMGKSDKPNIEYRFQQHIDYIDAFIAALGLKNITLVLHGFSSIIGMDYARRNPNNIKSIAFYEAYVGNWSDWNKFPLPIQQLSVMLNNLNADTNSFLQDNELVKKIFNATSLRKLSAAELEVYTQPFLRPEQRNVLMQYVAESPFGKNPDAFLENINKDNQFLEQSALPKLMLYTIPGFLTTVSNIEWCREHIKNLTLEDLGEGLHFVQEYNPERFAQALLDWYKNVVESERQHAVNAG